MQLSSNPPAATSKNNTVNERIEKSLTNSNIIQRNYNSSILALITAAEELKPGKPYSKEAKLCLVTMWMPILTVVGMERFNEAFQYCLESSPFRPDTYALRQYLGLDSAPPIETAAKDSLRWMIAGIRKHGKDGHASLGKLIRAKGRDESGKWHPDEYEMIPPPPIPPHIKATVLALGYGDWAAGMDLVASHPAIDKPQEAISLGLRLSAEEKLEAKWIEAWRRA